MVPQPTGPVQADSSICLRSCCRMRANSTKMEKAKIQTVRGLLKRGGTAKGRKELAEKTGISESVILKWVNMADLFRVKGIGKQYAELLEKAGVDTVKELRTRRASS